MTMSKSKDQVAGRDRTFPPSAGGGRSFLFDGSVLLVLFVFIVGINDTSARSAPDSSGQVWQVGDRRWDEADEKQFAAWIEETITEDFFIRYDIPVDCADVPYAIRWIYARIAHLPAAATGADGRLFGQWSTAWRNLPTDPDWWRDKRFRAALEHLLTETSTRTLPEDTYPIRISRDAVMAGAVFNGDGHAGIIGRIVLDGSMYSPIQTWEATLPRRESKLREGSYFSGWPDRDAGYGLLRFRWPVFVGGKWGYLPKESEPFYSVEQYDHDFFHTGELFDEAVARRIDPTRYDPAEKADKIITTIFRYLQQRVAIVRDGYRHCRQGACPEGSALWEVYSTPSRDDMIAFEIEHLQKLIGRSGLDRRQFAKKMETMALPIAEGKTVSLEYVVENCRWLSADPGDSIEARWGLRKCDMIRSRINDGLRTLEFVEQQYRDSDPVYADQSRKLQLAELERLRRQEREAGCGGRQPEPEKAPSRMIWKVLPIKIVP